MDYKECALVITAALLLLLTVAHIVAQRELNKIAKKQQEIAQQLRELSDETGGDHAHACER